MNKKDIEKLIFAALAILAILVVILVSASILAPAKRSSKAEKVDLSCVAEHGKSYEICRLDDRAEEGRHEDSQERRLVCSR